MLTLQIMHFGFVSPIISSSLLHFGQQNFIGSFHRVTAINLLHDLPTEAISFQRLVLVGARYSRSPGSAARRLHGKAPHDECPKDDCNRYSQPRRSEFVDEKRCRQDDACGDRKIGHRGHPQTMSNNPIVTTGQSVEFRSSFAYGCEEPQNHRQTQ
jgi:hypothetical protein